MSISNRDYLIAFSVKYKGDWRAIYNAIETKECLSEEEVFDLLKDLNSKTLTMLDENYPEALKRVHYAPFVLFYHGDISLINEFDRSLGVVGNRLFTEYGEKMTREMVKGVADKLIIVSGMAFGIDAIAADECMNVGGKTIAVLGSGINYVYPSENKDIYERIKRTGLILSEYPNETPPEQANFPARNRIIAGLSNNLLITEARVRSGTSITAGYVLERGTGSVLCVPQQADINSLCNVLIREGAKLVIEPEDVLEEFGIYLQEPEFSN